MHSCWICYESPQFRYNSWYINIYIYGVYLFYSTFTLPEIKQLTGHKSYTVVYGYIAGSKRMKEKAADALAIPNRNAKYYPNNRPASPNLRRDIIRHNQPKELQLKTQRDITVTMISDCEFLKWRCLGSQRGVYPLPKRHIQNSTKDVECLLGLDARGYDYVGNTVIFLDHLVGRTCWWDYNHFPRNRHYSSGVEIICFWSP